MHQAMINTNANLYLSYQSRNIACPLQMDKTVRFIIKVKEFRRIGAAHKGFSEVQKWSSAMK
eukprot:3567583-Ditylum_brightwellii.AAC.1